ncbi:hypothetical protein BJV78DRAFT_1171261 [Lactifluus subvellereus]|nr:hypothetical protein BJV78DRAFT_1171261 [Lactifluus subvellereus]
MSPTNLQGLNLVQAAQPSDSYFNDSQDLLNLSQFPELNAQLDIWTNLAFDSDEPLVRRNDKKPSAEAGESPHSVEDDEDDDPDDGQPAQADNHDNVVVGDPVPTEPTEPRTAPRPLNAFDIGSLLAGFGVDPFAVPPMRSTSTAPSLAQILSLYPHTAHPPPLVPAPAEPAPQQGAKARRTSVSKGTSDRANDSASPTAASAMGTPLTAAEDKRRRNTAASARFRLKKKEREAALEKKSKELEIRVTELERECEGLRRENGWLKGLVVGVTGVGATQQQSVPATAGVKRPREDADGVGK